MRAVVLREVGRPTLVEEIALRPLGANEVRVQIVASGIKAYLDTIHHS